MADKARTLIQATPAAITALNAYKAKEAAVAALKAQPAIQQYEAAVAALAEAEATAKGAFRELVPGDEARVAFGGCEAVATRPTVQTVDTGRLLLSVCRKEDLKTLVEAGAIKVDPKAVDALAGKPGGITEKALLCRGTRLDGTPKVFLTPKGA